jgi:nitrogen fixation NifU-like protein
MNHFLKPRHAGEIDGADGIGVAGNPVCGDKMTVYIKVSKGKIKKIKFKTFGCAAAIATSDMICDLAVGKNIEDAKRITRDEVADALGKLPPIKMHCSNLAADALKKAIENFESKR